MANTDAPRLPPPSPEHRRVAAGQFERANQVIATGNFDYGIGLLLSCCKLDPANLIYRQALRRTEKTKFKNNLRGSWHARLSSLPLRTKLTAALRARSYVKVLELGEQILTRNPWDTGAQVSMGEAADALGLLDLAVWTLEQARHKNPRDAAVNRFLARLYEKRGNFAQAIALWELVRRADPTDVEAQGKSKDLAASETIARGRYEDVAAKSGEVEGVAPDEGTATRARVPTPRTGEVKAVRGKQPTPSPDAPPSVPSAERGAREAAQVRARIETDPTNANAHLQLAALYRKNGQIDQARATLQAALGPTANAFEVAAELADLEIEVFRRDLVLTEEKQRAAPQDEELRQIRLRLMREINSRELELYRRKADRFPTEMAHRLELGVRLLRAGQVDEAIRELQAARSDPRQHWRSLLYLAYCFKTRNNWRLAKRNFEECLQHLPPGEGATRKEVLFQLAQGSAEAGDLSAAVELAHELANLDFAYKDIGRLLDEWQARLEQADV
ncbi:MAG TPA: tetratricopeptide repeat protein [Gemmataceae bacterium]|nr:tetratricopeptide repeat protein [Gemmataceae bacterium]